MTVLELSILSLAAFLNTPSHLSICLSVCVSLSLKDLLSPLQYQLSVPIETFLSVFALLTFMWE